MNHEYLQNRIARGEFGAILSLGTAQAAQIFAVDAWIGDLNSIHAGGTDADRPLPAGAADAHFTIAGPIDWFTSNGANLVGDFFTKDGGAGLPSITGYSSPSGAYAALGSFLGASMSTSGDAYSAFFHIVGTYSSVGAYAGSITHDDGASLYIDNGTINVFTHAPETSAVTDPAILPAGSHNFDLYYVEGNGAPSVLQIIFPNDVRVPEPASLALLGVGLLGLGLIRRRA